MPAPVNQLEVRFVLMRDAQRRLVGRAAPGSSHVLCRRSEVDRSLKGSLGVSL